MFVKRLVLTLAVVLAAVLAMTAPLLHAGGLVPPAGFTAPVVNDKKSPRACDEMPEPYTGKLEFPSKYKGSDSARDTLNPEADAQYKKMTEPIKQMEREVSAAVDHYLHGGHSETLECVLGSLERWAEADALMASTENHTGKSMRKWALGSLASAYLRLKFSTSQPLKGHEGRVAKIEKWFARLGEQVIADWDNPPLEKFNNHEYWAAWSVMATAVALDRRDMFDWALEQYRRAATQVDAEGYLPNELKRETRALHYHNYALGPLAMIAAFARANGVDVTREGDRALQRLAERVMQGTRDPQIFARRTGHEQKLEELQESSKFAWMEPYCATLKCPPPMTQRMRQLRPMKTYRLGGNVTELFAGRGPQAGRTPTLIGHAGER